MKSRTLQMDQKLTNLCAPLSL